MTSNPDRHLGASQLGDGTVPDKALEELLAVFAGDSPTEENEIDLDDPSIDQLLGLGPDVDPTDDGPEEEPADERAPESGDESADEPGDGLPATELPVTAAPGATDASEPHDLPTTEQPVTSNSGHRSGDVLVAEWLGRERADPDPDQDRRRRSRSPIPSISTKKPRSVYAGRLGRSTEASIREERTTILIGGDEIEGSSGGIPIGTGSATMDPRLRAGGSPSSVPSAVAD